MAEVTTRKRKPRLVKCCVTGEKGSTEEFIKVGKSYYKSQEIYEIDRQRRDSRLKLVDYICKDLLGYYEKKDFNTLLVRHLKDLEYYSNEVILETIRQKEKDIRYAIETKNLNTNSSKINYIFAIVRNHIADVHKHDLRIKKQHAKQDKQQIENEVDFEKVGARIPGKDITDWLDGDDL